MPNGWDTHKYYPLDSEYYQSKTHCLRRFSRKVVCELISAKLLNRADLYIGNDVDLTKISEVEQKKTHDKREDYATRILALFVPWMSSTDLLVSKRW